MILQKINKSSKYNLCLLFCKYNLYLRLFLYYTNKCSFTFAHTGAGDQVYSIVISPHGWLLRNKKFEIRYTKYKPKKENGLVPIW